MYLDWYHYSLTTDNSGLRFPYAVSNLCFYILKKVSFCVCMGNILFDEFFLAVGPDLGRALRQKERVQHNIFPYIYNIYNFFIVCFHTFLICNVLSN